MKYTPGDPKFDQEKEKYRLVSHWAYHFLKETYADIELALAKDPYFEDINRSSQKRGQQDD